MSIVKRIKYTIEFKLKTVAWYFENVFNNPDPKKRSYDYASKKLELERKMLTK